MRQPLLTLLGEPVYEGDLLCHVYSATLRRRVFKLHAVGEAPDRLVQYDSLCPCGRVYHAYEHIDLFAGFWRVATEAEELETLSWML